MIHRKELMKLSSAMGACLVDAEQELQQANNMVASLQQTVQGQAKTVTDLRKEIEQLKQMDLIQPIEGEGAVEIKMQDIPLKKKSTKYGDNGSEKV